jgi:hypothetical protein
VKRRRRDRESARGLVREFHDQPQSFSVIRAALE